MVKLTANFTARAKSSDLTPNLVSASSQGPSDQPKHLIGRRERTIPIGPAACQGCAETVTVAQSRGTELRCPREINPVTLWSRSELIFAPLRVVRKLPL